MISMTVDFYNDKDSKVDILTNSMSKVLGEFDKNVFIYDYDKREIVSPRDCTIEILKEVVNNPRYFVFTLKAS